MDHSEQLELTTEVWESTVGYLCLTVPRDVAQRFGRAERLPVVVELEGVEERGALYPDADADYFFVVRREMAERLKLRPGQRIRLRLRSDATPRRILPPRDLNEALKSHPVAEASFFRLSQQQQHEYIQFIEDVVSPEARRRRVEHTIEMLEMVASGRRSRRFRLDPRGEDPRLNTA